MSADELRQAAAAERDEWGGPENERSYPKSSAIHLALADWLDLAAETPAFEAFAKGRKSHVSANIAAALTVARLINAAAE